jgi:hypothetical protein
MRRIVQDYIIAALDRQKPDLEMYIAEHLEYPEAFPLVLDKPAVAIQWSGRVNIAPKFQADYPSIEVTTALRVAVTAESRRRDVARGVRTAAVADVVLGLRTFDMGVELTEVSVGFHCSWPFCPGIVGHFGALRLIPATG